MRAVHQLCALPVLLACLASGVTASAAERVALVVGNGAYESAAPLPNPTNDAAAMAEALSELGFEVILAEDVTRSGFDQSLRQFGQALRDAEVGLFFYAGHGMQVDGANYLIPVDARLASETDLIFEAVELRLVLNLMEQLVPTSIVFLDACRDNPMAQTLARSLGTRSSAVGRGLARVESGIGTLIAYATQPGNVALDGEGQHSPFAGALLEHIATPGLEIRQILTRVRESVLDATGRQQVPWDHSSLTGDFYFLASAPPMPAVAATPAATGAEIWQVIQFSNNPKDFEFFLQAYPDSPFAPFAQLRLDALAPTGPSAGETAAQEAAAAAAAEAAEAAARAQALQEALAEVEARLAAEATARAEAEASLASEAAARAAAEAEAKRLAEAAALAKAEAAATEQARQEALAQAEAARQERESAEAALEQATAEKGAAAHALAEAERKNAQAAADLARAEAEARRLAEEAALAQAAAAANDQARQEALAVAAQARQEREAAESALVAAEDRSQAAEQALAEVQASAAAEAEAAAAATQPVAQAAAAQPAEPPAAPAWSEPAAPAPAPTATAEVAATPDSAEVQLALLESGEAALGLDKAARQQVQRALTLIGYDTHGVDGAFGKNSRAAISGYQSTVGAAVTGYLDAATYARLMQDAADELAAWEKAEAERRKQAEQQAAQVAAAITQPAAASPAPAPAPAPPPQEASAPAAKPWAGTWSGEQNLSLAWGGGAKFAITIVDGQADIKMTAFRSARLKTALSPSGSINVSTNVTSDTGGLHTVSVKGSFPSFTVEYISDYGTATGRLRVQQN